MQIIKRLGSIVGMAALASSVACSTDLTVPNQNNPDVKRALASPQDVQKLATSSVNSWYLTSTFYRPLAMLTVTADELTANFGNFGMRFNNVEPRIAYTNSSAADDGLVAFDTWSGNYQVLGAANDALRAFASGLSLGSADTTEMFKELAMFSQAGAMTNLALTFDKAFIVDETTDPAKAKPSLVPYGDVTTAALAKWDALIAASSGKNFEYDPSVIPLQGGPLTSAKLNRIANTMAGLLTAYSARTAAERDTKVNWQKVLTYTDKGIGTGSAGAPFDFTVIGDNDQWYSYFLLYADYPSWMRVDMRVIHMMDPSQPAEFDGTIPPQATGDKRLDTDIKYLGKVTGDATRGVYMQSPYYHKRYEYHSWQSATYATGPAPYILAAESDLLRAEALIRTGGDLTAAANLINNTRVTRGGLKPASAADGKTALLDDIMYERDIELMATNGWVLFRNRMEDRLRAGTVRHLPVPAKELEIQAMPIYTFGGAGNEK
jgi:hypothetical protein